MEAGQGRRALELLAAACQKSGLALTSAGAGGRAAMTSAAGFVGRGSGVLLPHGTKCLRASRMRLIACWWRPREGISINTVRLRPSQSHGWAMRKQGTCSAGAKCACLGACMPPPSHTCMHGRMLHALPPRLQGGKGNAYGLPGASVHLCCLLLSLRHPPTHTHLRRTVRELQAQVTRRACEGLPPLPLGSSTWKALAADIRTA